MRSFALLTAGSVVLSGLAMPAFAEKEDECRLQANIVDRAVELRLERKSQKKATKMMTSGDDEAVAEKYLPAVPYLVDWVYVELTKEQLGMDPGPGEAYFTTCMSQ